MSEITESPDGVGGTITVRLDSRTAERLYALVEHFSENDALGRKVSASQVVRAGVDALYVRHLTINDTHDLRAAHTKALEIADGEAVDACELLLDAVGKYLGAPA